MARVVAGCILAALFAATLTAWYLNCPRDLRLEGVDVGSDAVFAGIDPSPDDQTVVRISFSSRTDLRAMMLDGLAAWTVAIIIPCHCFETGSTEKPICNRYGEPLFDTHGYINTYNKAYTSSFTQSSPRARYHFLLPLEENIPFGEKHPSEILIRHPTDLCIQVVRYSLLIPMRHSNIVRVTKERISKEIALARANQSAAIAAEAFDKRLKSTPRPALPQQLEYAGPPILINPLTPGPSKERMPNDILGPYRGSGNYQPPVPAGP